MKKSIGVNIQPPKEKCSSDSCAWHGTISIRGRIFKGVVRSAKLHKTAAVEWGYNKYSQKYERYERRKTRITAHNPDCIKAKEGDAVVIGECRPISKTKKFVILAKVGEGLFKIKGEDLAKKEEAKAESEEAKAEKSEKEPETKEKKSRKKGE